MRKINYIFLLLLIACSGENVNDCVQTAGKIVQQEVNTVSFTKILVNRNIELVLSQGSQTEVVIETGENLLNDIEAVVVGNELQLTNNNTCNYVRDYGITKVYITAPDITEIRSSSQFDVSSAGILSYDSLHLISEDFNIETFAVGDFKLQLAVEELKITSNKLATFYMSGHTENLHVGFYGGAGRFEGANLIAQEVSVFHRGSNDMIINPQQSLTGEIRSTGNVIAVNQPPIVAVEEFYTGRLIFN